jgi:hypothetical protein
MPSQGESVALRLADEAIAELTESIAPNLVNILRRLLRACILLDWKREASWMRLELGGFDEVFDADHVPLYRFARCVVSQTAWIEHDVFPESITTTTRGERAVTVAVGTLAQLVDSQLDWDTGKIESIEGHDWVESVTVHAREIRRILTYVEHRAFELALRIERHLRFGELVSSIFDEYRARTQDALSRLGIDESLEAIEANLRVGTAESYKLAVHGCRNVLIGLSDKLWRVPDLTRHPSLSTYDGKPLQLDRGQVKARLRAYLYERGLVLVTNRGPSLVAGQLDRVASTIEQLYNLSSDQAKREASLDEAQSAVIQTYILLGEIARLTGFEPVTEIDSGDTPDSKHP